MNFSTELLNSFIIENSRLTDNIVKNLLAYDGLDIKIIHQIMVENKKPFMRNKYVYVVNNFGEICHIGLQSSKINYEQLQQWVDKFYEYSFKSNVEKMFSAFILYLLYVRIHPHEDGNGRTARYLFLENKKLEGTNNYFPLSSMLSNPIFRDIDDEMHMIFKEIDITEKGVDESDYLTLKLNDTMIKKILHLMYCVILYKHLKVNDSVKCNEFEKYETFPELITKYKPKFAGVTFTEDNMIIIDEMKTFLKKYINLEQHVKVLRVLNV